jgi:uncharacterized protein with GYD domain
MAKYLFQISYTTEGVRGVLADGGSKRKQVATQLTKSLGGKMESFYFAFGGTDLFCIVDVPDHAAAAAAALTIGASGAASVTTTVLMTPAEVDDACSRTVKYTPPGT